MVPLLSARCVVVSRTSCPLEAFENKREVVYGITFILPIRELHPASVVTRSPCPPPPLSFFLETVWHVTAVRMSLSFKCRSD